ncbi:MAG: SMC-Scp complex subunit ScpB [Chitinophagaceae bacterium]|nr:SMC-Scp complex subunit ScpB [Chitinophagaceae bacterium]
MEISNLIPHIEALIFASDRPLTAMDLTELINNAFGFMEDKVTMDQVQTGIDGIVEKYQSQFYPFEMKESGGGWQFLTKKDFHKTVAQLNGEKFLKRLSTAALETLAIIAYKQPITKADIESIRGVNSDYSIQKLLEKELVVITGRNEEMPGKPLVYATSKTFMDYFGINSPQDLPKLKEIYDEAMIQPTTMHDENNSEKGTDDDEQNVTGEIEISGTSVLVVSENGQLVEDHTEDDSDASNNPGDPDAGKPGPSTDQND